MIVIVFAAIVFTPFMFMRARRGASDAAPTAYSIEPPGATKVRNPDDLAAGIRQVEGGDLEAAVLTLDAVIQRLSREKGRERDLAVAHLYLGMTHLGLGQREKAAAEMRHAWNNDQEMKLDPKKFPPPVVQFYRQTTAALAMRSDRNAAALRPASPPAMSAPTNSSRQGSLDLRILPWAEVTVDGRKVGTTPLRLLTLEAGQHDVILNHPDYKPLQRRVTIRPGQIVKLEVDLALDGSPR